MSRKESQMRKTIVKTAIDNLTAPVYTHAVSLDVCINECFMVAINDLEMREYMATRTDRQVSRMGGEVKRAVDRHFNRQIIREVYVAHNTIGRIGHKVFIERMPRGGGERTERWYGVNGNVSESSLNRLHRVLLSIQIRAGIGGEWMVGSGIYKEGMYTRLWR